MNEPDPDPGKLRLLLSYAAATPRMISDLNDRKHDLTIMIDSGAFSAWRIGAQITVAQYCGFLDRLPFDPYRYLQLDVVGDPFSTRKNYYEMRKAGYDPVPVFTRGAPVEHLLEYLNESDMVAIGGLVRTKGNGGYVNGVMKVAKQGPQGSKVHLLGFKKIDHLKFWRPYSCDSTNWTRGGRYGWIDCYMGQGLMQVLLKKNIGRDLDQSHQRAQTLAARIRRYGIDPYSLRLAAEWSKGTGTAMVIPAYSWVDYAFDAGLSIGVNIFLAFINPWQLQTLIAAWEKVKPMYFKEVAA